MSLDKRLAVTMLLRSIHAEGGTMPIPILKFHGHYDDPSDYLEEALEEGLVVLQPGTSGPAVLSITSAGKKAIGIAKKCSFSRIFRIAWQRRLLKAMSRYKLGPSGLAGQAQHERAG